MTALVKQIIDSGRKIYLGITGGGAEAIGELTRYGGASAVLVGAEVPWDQEALKTFIHGKPDKFCSEPTARAMAASAYHKGINCGHRRQDVVGVGATAKLTTGPGEREGREHVLHIAFQTYDTTTAWEFRIEPLLRQEQERIVGHIILQTLWAACGMDQGDRLAEYLPTQKYTRKSVTGDPEIVEVIHGIRPLYMAAQVTPAPPQLIFAGSFNPIHRKHIEVMQVAHKLTGKVVNPEISIHNTDKPALDYVSIADRVKVFQERCAGLPFVGGLYLTDAPMFRRKADLFPRCTFVVGTDTYNRITDPKYQGSTARLLQSFEEFKELGVRFLVFQRGGVDINRQYATLASITDVVPAGMYVDDGHSSTKERNGQ